jgi:hypothetical protein
MLPFVTHMGGAVLPAPAARVFAIGCAGLVPLARSRRLLSGTAAGSKGLEESPLVCAPSHHAESITSLTQPICAFLYIP